MGTSLKFNYLYAKKRYLMKCNRCWLFLFLFSILACQDNSKSHLTIATAANLQFAMQEIITAFTKETGIKGELILSSSGKLTAQIKEGAPFDVFVSADMAFPTELFNHGLTTTKPIVYAYGKLVLWTMKEQLKPSIELLQNEEIKHIALANPKTAPYGKAAMEVLRYHELIGELEGKLVFGESILQTNQFVHSEAAELGLTAKSVIRAKKMRDQGQWIDLDSTSYTPIAQGIVILKTRPKQLSDAQQFYNFLFSETSKEILTNFGYSTPN